MKRLRLFAIALVMLSLTNAFSQAKLSGSVRNSQDAGISFATVALLARDSSLVKAASTDGDGYFEFPQISYGAYLIEIRNIEYDPLFSDVITVNQNEVFVMSKATRELDEVVVGATRQLVEVLPDRMIFNVSSSVNTSGNNGLELLSKAPGVVIDPDNNVILQGKVA